MQTSKVQPIINLLLTRSATYYALKFEETMKGNGLEVGIARGDSVVIVYGKRPNVSKTIW